MQTKGRAPARAGEDARCAGAHAGQLGECKTRQGQDVNESHWIPGRQWRATGRFLVWEFYDQECVWGRRHWPQLQRLRLYTIHTQDNLFWCHLSLVHHVKLLIASNPVCHPQYPSWKVWLFIVCCDWWQPNCTHMRHCDLHRICTSIIHVILPTTPQGRD